MGKAGALKTNFTGGEVSPFVAGRVDIAKYANGARELKNCIVRPQGGFTRRSGFRNVCEVRDSSVRHVMVPFEASAGTGYSLLFGQNYIWILKDRVPVLDLGTVHDEPVTAVSSHPGGSEVTSTPVSRTISDVANNGSGFIRITTTTDNGYRVGSLVQVTGTGRAELDNLVHTVTKFITTKIFDVGTAFVAVAAAGTAKSSMVRPGDPVVITGSISFPAINGTWRIAYTTDYNKYVLANSAFSGPFGGALGTVFPRIIEVPTTYLEAELPDISYAQSVDVMYLAHKAHKPAKLQRYADNADVFSGPPWLLADVVAKDGPYLPLQATSSKDYNNPQNVTSNPNVFLHYDTYAHTATVNSETNFGADQNKFIEYRKGDQWRLAQLGAANPTGTKTATVKVIENVLLFLDETNKIVSKPTRQPPVYQRSGTSTSASYPGAAKQSKVDPNNEVQSSVAGTGAGILRAQFANTFGVADIGKYVRYSNSAGAFLWAQITSLVRGTNGLDANHGAAVAMASNQGTGKYILSGESRTVQLIAFEGQVDTATFVGAKLIFGLCDVGRKIRLGFGGRWTWGNITGLTGAIGGRSSIITATMEEDFPRNPQDATHMAGNQNPANPETGITYDWRIGAWSDESFVGSAYPALHGAGWPSVVIFHEQRLVFARSMYDVQTVWKSRSNDFDNFAPTDLDGSVPDDAAITYTVTSGKLNPIQWMSSGAVLLIGGLGGEWQARAASSILEPITPTNLSITPQTEYGSKQSIRARRVGSGTLFVTRSGMKLRELVYNFQLDAFEARDLTIVGEHVFRNGGGAVLSEYQRDPINIYWAVLANGRLGGLTYEKDQEIVAWHTHQAAQGSALLGEVETMACLTTLGQHDDVYAVVRRSISSVIHRYIETLDPIFSSEDPADRPNMFFVDSGITVLPLNGATFVNGLVHLEGETVSYLGDGVVQADVVIAGGQANLAGAYAKVQIGLKYDSLLRVLPWEAGGIIGTAQAKTKRVNKLGIRVLGTPNLFHRSTNADTWVRHNFQAGTGLYSGDDVIPIVQGYNLTGEFQIKQDRPEPMTVLLLAPELDTYEEQ